MRSHGALSLLVTITLPTRQQQHLEMTSETDRSIAIAATTLERTELKAPGNFQRKLNSASEYLRLVSSYIQAYHVPFMPVDKYSDATSQPFATAVNTTISSGVGSFVVSQLSGWSAASSALIATLEELQRVHPFINGNNISYTRNFR